MDTTRDELSFTPIRRAKRKKKNPVLDSSNEDLGESTDSKDDKIVIPWAVISKSPKRRVLQNSRYVNQNM